MSNIEFLKETSIHNHTIDFKLSVYQHGSGDVFQRCHQRGYTTTAYIDKMELGIIFSGTKEDLDRFCQVEMKSSPLTQAALDNLHFLATKQKEIKIQQREMHKKINEFVTSIRTKK